jgi:hypothetical protein
VAGRSLWPGVACFPDDVLVDTRKKKKKRKDGKGSPFLTPPYSFAPFEAHLLSTVDWIQLI